jgi:hypothetical protein
MLQPLSRSADPARPRPICCDPCGPNEDRRFRRARTRRASIRRNGTCRRCAGRRPDTRSRSDTRAAGTRIRATGAARRGTDAFLSAQSRASSTVFARVSCDRPPPTFSRMSVAVTVTATGTLIVDESVRPHPELFRSRDRPHLVIPPREKFIRGRRGAAIEPDEREHRPLQVPSSNPSEKAGTDGRSHPHRHGPQGKGFGREV